MASADVAIAESGSAQVRMFAFQVYRLIARCSRVFEALEMSGNERPLATGRVKPTLTLTRGDQRRSKSSAAKKPQGAV